MDQTVLAPPLFSCLECVGDTILVLELVIKSKWSRYHPMVQKFYCERYLSIQSMLGKKEKKYQHFNIFDYTYLPKTDICLSFFLFFL